MTAPAGTLSGVDASIEWTYYKAAAVNGYRVMRDPDTRQWWAVGTIVLADAFKLSRSPLEFVARYKGGAWRWPIVDPVPRVAGPFRIRLGPPIRTGVANVEPHA